MKFSAHQIAEMIQGTVKGNPDVEVSSIAKIEEAQSGSLTFLANPKYESFIYETKASLALVAANFEPSETLPSTLTLIAVEEPYQAFATLLEAYQNLRAPEKGIHPSAFVHESATIGEGVSIASGAHIAAQSHIGDHCVIGANAFIGPEVAVGAHSNIQANVSIAADCKIGAHCTFHHGVVIGSDGFGFAPTDTNDYRKVPQIGNVVIEDYVEIGANTCVDRATLGSTYIRKGVKLDNLIQIAHNVEIGEHTVIAAQTGIAGSTKIGKHCMIGGQVGIVGHLTIADEVKIAAQSGISSSIPEKGMIVQGSPAIPIRDYKMSYVGFKKLPDLMKQINELERRIKELGQ